MSSMQENEDGTISFPALHERVTPLTAADQARIRLAAAMRILITDSFLSTAPNENVDAAIHHIEEAIKAVQVDGVSGTAAADSHFSDRSPFYGAMNPISMPMVMEHDPSVGEFGAVIGTGTFTEPYEGPPGHIHGGFIAAAFDEVLGMAQSLTGRPGMTGTLSIKYRSPTPLNTPIVYKGWVDRVEGRKIFTKGQSFNGDTLCAEAEVLFLSMPPEMMDLLKKPRDLRK